jgi:hypothetical protein
VHDPRIKTSEFNFILIISPIIINAISVIQVSKITEVSLSIITAIENEIYSMEVFYLYWKMIIPSKNEV